MHISDSHQANNTPLTKCSKMTEEGVKRHGMNGNFEGATSTIKEEVPRSSYGQGGRLKFFKDGKFILELERAREGERMSWVSVPRKTFWPPQGTAASTPTYRQESSTSLSVSDDNSSIQSSPWQRDHSWKQTTPKRNLSKGMGFYFKRLKSFRKIKPSRKRRRPYSLSPEPDVPSSKVLCGERTTKDSVCNSKVYNIKRKVKKSLNVIVQILVDRTVSSTPPRAEMVVSPRKRILREMEKDKVHVEDACQKRSRNKIPSVSTSTSFTNLNLKVESPVRVNGTTEEVRTPRNNSYSITSLLADDRNSRRSPDTSPSHFSPAAQAQYCSPPPEDRWYSESVDRLRSIELSQVDKRALSAYSPYPYMPHYMYPYSLPPYYYGRGYVPPPVYSGSHMPLPVRPDVPSCSWTAEPTRDTEHRDENVTDMPLNLSKHAG